MVEKKESYPAEDWSSDEEEPNCAIDDGIVIKMNTCTDLDLEEGPVVDADVCLRVQVPVHSQARRAPVDIVCCIDVSGSMQAIAEYES
jgi:hypothetical protein